MSRPILVADSITQVKGRAAVVVNGSHGGVHAAYLAAQMQVAVVIFNDAGVGLEGAGIAGLTYLGELGVPAATVGHLSAEIGAGADTLENGVISYLNAPARRLGVTEGLSARQAAARLAQAPPLAYAAPEISEAARLIEASYPRVIAIDSASLVAPEHRDALLICGSHGGLLGGASGGRDEQALKHDALGVVFNDAGGGKADAGFSRLEPLTARDIPAATVAHSSAKIGDACSGLKTGVISRVNAKAAQLGLAEGMSLQAFIARLRAHYQRQDAQ